MKLIKDDSFPKLTESFNKAGVPKGDVFEIEVAVTPGSKEEWEMEVVSGKAKLLGRSFPPAPGKNGKPAPGRHIQRFFFRASEELGKMEIKGICSKPDQKEPVRTQSFSVTVW